MNTLDDLRTVLAIRAEAVTDTAAGARTAAVVERSRAARRRRTVNSLIGAVVVAVAAAGIAVPLTHVHRSAPVPAGDLRVEGVDVPKQVTLDQFGYAYSSVALAPASTATGVVKERRFRVKVPASDRNQAVLLVVSGLSHGFVALNDANGDTDDIVAPGYPGVPVLTYTQKTSYTVVAENVPADAKFGLVTYRRTTALPAGVRHGDSVFRRHIGGRTLVAAVWAKPGQTKVSLDVPGDLSRDVLVAYCQSSASHVGYVLHLGSGDGSVSAAGSGCGPAEEDAGSMDSVTPGGHYRGFHHLVLDVGRSTDWRHVRPVPPGEVGAIGLAVYRLGATTRVLGTNVEHTIDVQGQNWTLRRIVPSAGAIKRMSYQGGADTPTVYGLVVGSSHGGSVTTTSNLSDEMPDMDNGPGPSSWTTGPLFPHGDYRIEVKAQRPVRSALLVYQPARPEN